jgi:hypothetical protein
VLYIGSVLRPKNEGCEKGEGGGGKRGESEGKRV